MLWASGCAITPIAQVSSEKAAERYFDADTSFFNQRFAKGSVAEALAALVANDERAPRMLEAALHRAADADLTARLGPLVVREHVVDYDYREASAAADRMGLADVLTPVERAYAGFPEPRAASTSNVVEVPYTNGKIPAKVNGREVTIVFDTGAPNIGINGGIVEALNLTVDRSVSRMSRVPAYGLEFPVFATMIDELTIGELTVFHAPANFGEIPDDQRANAERLRRETGGAEVIMGLDALRPFVDIIEFDWEKDVVRLVVKADMPPKRTNYILNPGRAPVIKIMAGDRETNLSYDSGAYGHIVGPETVEAARDLGRRVYDRGSFKFSEALIGVQIEGVGPIALWASSRRFAEDEDFGVSGVLGVLNDGVLALDTRSRSLSIRDYDPRDAFYAFPPTTEEVSDEAQPFLDGEASPPR